MLLREMDCADLLNCVQSAESSLLPSASAVFGHPPVPVLHACHCLPVDHEEEEVFLLVARTKRCVCAQMWVCSADEPPRASPITEILLLRTASTVTIDTGDEDKDESISCATILTLDRNFHGDDARVPHLTRVVVVVGTSCNRVLCSELVLETWTTGQRTLRRANDDRPIFEPLPLDIDIFRKSHECATSVKDSDPTLSDDCDGPTVKESVTEVSSQNEPLLDTPPFRPQGGVISIKSYATKRLPDKEYVTRVWVAYRDGTAVRLHHACFFASRVHKSLVGLGSHGVVRTRVMLPPQLEEAGALVLPLPNYYPTLSCAFSFKQASKTLDEDRSLETPRPSTAHPPDDEQEKAMSIQVPEIYEAMSYGADNGASFHGIPSVSFYTSENHFSEYPCAITRSKSTYLSPEGELLDSIKDNVIGGTKALLGGVIGGAVGAVKRGFKSNIKEKEEEINVSEHDFEIPSKQCAVGSRVDIALHTMEPLATLTGLREGPNSLFTGTEMYDSPRLISTVSVDPDGMFAAAADNLGRVLLIDLSTKQVIRMWKGVRDALCYWIQRPGHGVGESLSRRPILYLLIHSRQRRALEIWRMCHGPRILSTQVGRDAQVIEYREATKDGFLSSCFLVHCTSPGRRPNKVEPIWFKDGSVRSSSRLSLYPKVSAKSGVVSSQEDALQLQFLKQLLAETNVPSSSETVFEAFTRVSSLTDLGIALDLLATSRQLEENMRVEGASFQLLALSHCQDKLNSVVNQGGKRIYENPNVVNLASKISFHTQVAEAYRVACNWQTHSDDENDDINVVPKSAWAVESSGWIDTFELATGTSVDSDLTTNGNNRMRFFTFANACCSLHSEAAFENGVYTVQHRIHFTDSTRTRIVVLGHLFRPLLEDMFAFKVVDSVFNNLGISTEYDYLLKCFGEWFMTLPARYAARKSFYVWNSPLVRWLQGVVLCQLEDENRPEILLDAVHVLCLHSSSLVRAFLLSALCREAVAVGARQREEKTYGKISFSKSVKPWDSLLRKLRVCIFVSLRLHDVRLGAFPLTVTNVNKDSFSVYEWVARDELMMSHSQREIAAFEEACKSSSLIFHPSLDEGDDPLRVKRLQRACLVRNAPKSRHGFTVSADPNLQHGALLLYLSGYNKKNMLVAHRTLLLSVKWGQEPDALHILQNSLAAMEALYASGDQSVAKGVSFEMWQTSIRPVFRAALFGFHDVPELSEEVIAPLLSDEDWFRAFGQIALQVLTIMSQLDWEGAADFITKKARTNGESDAKDDPIWPPTREDFVLEKMVQKLPKINHGALDLHKVIVCASLLSDDLSPLPSCVPDFYGTFLQKSLSLPASARSSNTDRSREFVEGAIVRRAEGSVGGSGLVGPVLDNLQLGEVDILGEIWGIPAKHARTTFLLAMYELGKDTMVDDLLSSSIRLIDVVQFVDSGVDIACRRLDETLIALQQEKSVRSQVLGLLDADVCHWIRERSETSDSLLKQYSPNTIIPDSPLSLSHTFILRLLSLSAASEAKETRIKLHSLSVLSGTLLREHI